LVGPGWPPQKGPKKNWGGGTVFPPPREFFGGGKNPGQKFLTQLEPPKKKKNRGFQGKGLIKGKKISPIFLKGALPKKLKPNFYLKIILTGGGGGAVFFLGGKKKNFVGDPGDKNC